MYNLNIFEYNAAVNKLSDFFRSKNFIKVPTQSELSILAACEDPATISQFIFDGINYPLPQTGQLRLEEYILRFTEMTGVWCETTSYRNEPFPIPGRHDKIFPMCEFEGRGDVNDLIAISKEILKVFNFPEPVEVNYEDICEEYGVSTIEAPQESRLYKEYGPVVIFKTFPLRSHPFWNMKYLGNDSYSKVDIILYGIETFGMAERSCNVDEMKRQFLHISGGKYSGLLFSKFGKERVLKELDEYLSLPMTPRYGGGIGLTRLVRAINGSVR